MNYFILNVAIGFFHRNIFPPEVINAEPHQSSSLPLADTCLSICIIFFFFFLAPDTKQSIFVIQDLFEEISSGKKSSRALAGELLQIMTCNLVNTLKHKDPSVGIRPLHMWPCALHPPPPESHLRDRGAQLTHASRLRGTIT